MKTMVAKAVQCWLKDHDCVRATTATTTRLKWYDYFYGSKTDAHAEKVPTLIPLLSLQLTVLVLAAWFGYVAISCHTYPTATFGCVEKGTTFGSLLKTSAHRSRLCESDDNKSGQEANLVR